MKKSIKLIFYGKNDTQVCGFAMVEKVPSPWKRKFKKILPAYLYRQDLQKGARKFFKNKWVSRYLTFGDFLVPKNCSSTINKTWSIKKHENSAYHFGDNYLTNHRVKFL